MTVMRWFRRNNKKLMAIFVVAIMIAFTLPSIMFQGSGRRDPGKDTVAFYRQPDGSETDISRKMLIDSELNLRILQGFGADAVTFADIFGAQQTGQEVRSSDIAIYLLLFPGSRYSQNIRSAFYQQAQRMGWLMDEEKADTVMRIIGAEPNKANIYYLLLAKEARQAGIQAAQSQIDQFLQNHGKYRQMGLPLPNSIASITQEFGISEKALKNALAEYLAILQYGRTITDSLALSEPELKKTIRDMVEWENITGTFVSFNARDFIDPNTDPSPEELDKHFQAYKTKKEGDFNDENPHGFGYMLSDRVQVEYLQLDLKLVKKQVDDQFAQLASKEQETKVEQYWSQNRERFRIQLPPAEGQDNQQPQYKDPEFGEIGIYTKAEQLLKNSLIQQEAQRLLELSKQQSQQASASQPADYANLAKQTESQPLPLAYGKTAYLSYQDAQNYQDFRSVYKIAKGQPQQDLLQILFSCEPLHKGFVTRIEEPPAALFEDIGPVLPDESALETGSAYLVRITAVDPARQPISLADDGRLGPAENLPPDAEPVLAETVKNDWKKLQGYLVAQKKAQAFAQQAKADWQAALTEANKALITDPNQTPDQGPIQETTLADVKRNLEYLQQYSQYQNSPNIFAALFRNTQMIRKAIDLFNTFPTDSPSLPLLDTPENFSCTVFKDLQATPPDVAEYLRRKPIVTQNLQQQNQQLLALTQFNPVNLEKRNGFREYVMDTSDKETEK
ncbi:MAG: hypothetical protein BWY71_00526 [Planctomycetes bacterium ADurb.Bin412]|nr:MAG: hypothetical protein BWY71_00526 [Planctomycetes bacterium ADurb.Bin412]